MTADGAAGLPLDWGCTDLHPKVLRGVLGARRKPLTVLGLDDLGLAGIGPATAVVSVQQRPRHTGGARVVDDGTAAGQLADYLTRLRVG